MTTQRIKYYTRILIDFDFETRILYLYESRPCTLALVLKVMTWRSTRCSIIIILRMCSILKDIIKFFFFFLSPYP
jgi:hypothetical protein